VHALCVDLTQDGCAGLTRQLCEGLFQCDIDFRHGPALQGADKVA
jgi:hypothetical protein